MNDTAYMKLALDLARNTAGQTSPNPVVGAVAVKNGRIIGMGAHLKAGEPHAEVHALKMAGEEARDATLYVTLEPCSHYGRTPPCSDLIVRTGLKRVVVATTDPNPQVAGKGIERMRKAGITVDTGLLKEEADELNKIFFHYISTGKPFVTLKSAVSLDGKTATVTGESKWITGAEAREDVHQFRHMHDGILVGVNTVLKDNPTLTTRLPEGGKNPVRIILDSGLRTPEDSLIVTDTAAPVWIFTGADSDAKKAERFENNGIRIFRMPQKPIKIEEVLKTLAEEEITSLFVEGGSEVHGSFLKAGAFQQVITYIAPKLIGGKAAPSSFGGEGIASMSDTVPLVIKEVKQIGRDLRIIAVPENPAPSGGD
ncbi:bifunctional diaminohydroxyphosphoribosylaminopyrimidine deaminase/5-amino-6-(5-phosphoribosylamino)uracil reductase RibD [Bacillus marinisedimentorum]|uniref:bifunctional diaminohydroxyphosphoribosylaminopyrimidine deaminase/5-amino-6-(5-phosphoribosylamino)uracil reductase RibD n=1 Tax=Bacillus marinisedimentorum TaxID=1821260 RepID=UPI0007E0C095|nr:bifunctional diaminohydroxyphosphoribosylaminopyrimidine deaminase/5-amino-6-(5-phosphoribosylamino)uracil reductase RibD [Bacillus marinisedimentorum]